MEIGITSHRVARWEVPTGDFQQPTWVCFVGRRGSSGRRQPPALTSTPRHRRLVDRPPGRRCLSCEISATKEGHGTSPAGRGLWAWKRRPEDCLAAAHSRFWRRRTLSGASRLWGKLDRAVPVMPSRGPLFPAPPKSGPFPPTWFIPAINGTTTPSDSRCAPSGFTIGLSTRSLLTRLHRRASPVPNAPLCTCRSPYPGGTRQRTGRNTNTTRRGLHRDMSGSAPPL